MKRRWFQVHLSTAILMMFASGALIGVNLLPRHAISYISDYDVSGAIFDPVISQHAVCGWPFVFQRAEVVSEVTTTTMYYGSSISLPIERISIIPLPLIADITIGAMLLGVFAMITEAVIRRREAHAS